LYTTRGPTACWMGLLQAGQASDACQLVSAGRFGHADMHHVHACSEDYKRNRHNDSLQQEDVRSEALLWHRPRRRSGTTTLQGRYWEEIPASGIVRDGPTFHGLEVRHSVTAEADDIFDGYLRHFGTTPVYQVENQLSGLRRHWIRGPTTSDINRQCCQGTSPYVFLIEISAYYWEH